MARRHYGRDLWDRMCKFVEKPDDLPTTPLGYWTADKLFFVGHYLAVVTHAGSGTIRQWFNSLNYLDFFCGNGVCVNKSRRESRYPGSAMLAAGCDKPFDNLILVDSDSTNIAALEARLQRFQTASKVLTIAGDANERVDEIRALIPDKSLSIAFFDPYALTLQFSTLEKITRDRSTDLIILFPDAMDIVRNVQAYYYPRKSEKLDHVFGADFDWRARWDALQVREGPRVREFFSQMYVERLTTLGYPSEFCDIKDIRSKSGPLYKLIFASKSSLGLKFWHIACRDTLGGERGLWGV